VMLNTASVTTNKSQVSNFTALLGFAERPEFEKLRKKDQERKSDAQ
jgi:hypothetical protein